MSHSKSTKDQSESTNPVSRRSFLITSIALSLGIPGCFNPQVTKNPVEPTATDKNKPQPPSKQPQPPSASNDVIYYTRNDAEYAKYKQPFNKRIQASPKVIAVCLNEKGVQHAVRYARYYKLPIAIKSGGHSFEGYSVNDDGLVIELSRMNKLSYDPVSKTVTAQPGCKLADVYEYLAKFNRLLPAGSCGGVGVAGLTLGGGYGFFSRKMGLTCDNLLHTRLVDGKGSLHKTANNPELLWGSKGGGNGNYGVTTQFVFKTHPAPRNFTSYLYKFYQLDSVKAKELARFWFEQMKTLPNTCYGSYILGHKTLTILVTDTEEQPTPVLASLLNKFKAKASRTYSPSKRPLLEALQRYQGRSGPLYFKNVSAGYYRSFADLDNVFISVHQRMRKQRGMLLQINTLGGAINNPQLEASAAYPHRKELFLGELQVYWDKASQIAKAVKSVQEIQTLFTKSGITKHYRNYPDIDLPNWQQAYYGDNYARLQGLKRKYDPDNVFQHPQSVTS